MKTLLLCYYTWFSLRGVGWGGTFHKNHFCCPGIYHYFEVRGWKADKCKFWKYVLTSQMKNSPDNSTTSPPSSHLLMYKNHKCYHTITQTCMVLKHLPRRVPPTSTHFRLTPYHTYGFSSKGVINARSQPHRNFNCPFKNTELHSWEIKRSTMYF